MTVRAEPDQVVELSALGARLQVDLTGASAEQVERFRRIWHRCLEGSFQPGGAGHRVDAGTVEAGSRFAALKGADPQAESRQLMQLTQQITGQLIAAQAGRMLLLHAGALAHPGTGASIVYVAPGGTGKTTLSRTLGRSLCYLTDETVGITDTGTILPYPKPLSIRRDPHDGVKDETAPGELGLLAPAAAPWVAGVVVLRRDASVEGLIAEEVDVLDALVMLAPETSSLARLERPLHQLAQMLESTGGLRLLRYAEATALEPVVREITGRTR